MSDFNETHFATVIGRIQGRLDMIGSTLCSHDEKFDKILDECKNLISSIHTINQRCTDREKHCSYRADSIVKQTESNVVRLDSLTQSGIESYTRWSTLKIIAFAISGTIAATLATVQLLHYLVK